MNKIIDKEHKKIISHWLKITLFITYTFFVLQLGTLVLMKQKALSQVEQSSLTEDIIQITETVRPAPATELKTLPIPTLGIGSSIISNVDGMQQLFVPAGEFIMGADDGDPRVPFSSKREVFLDAFWIDRTEVDNYRYQKCVDSGSCSPPISTRSHTRNNYFYNPEFADYPVIYVTWFQAAEYCNWAGRRLPTEAEWEKAARGIDGRIYPWGNNDPDENLLNYRTDSGDTAPVESFTQGASPYGALNMAGNVSEWVADWYG